MATSIPAHVRPAVLRWARETVGLSQIAASRKMGLADNRVEQWENGTAQPTVAQLRKAAEVYHRVLAVFFLPQPPVGFDTLRDFRRLDGALAGEWSPELHAEYRRAQAQRDNALELFELDERVPSTLWQLNSSAASDDGLAVVVRAALLDLAPLPFPKPSGTPYEHLNMWTSALEEAGVLVMATRRGQVRTAEMRAFSLYFDLLPVIMVNGADSPRGRLFSLLHEYVHLLLHTSGLCDMVTDQRATSPNRQLEARCNAVAAAILLPGNAVSARPEVVVRAHDQTLWTYQALRAAAAPFGVSTEAFLRRLVTLGYVDMSFYQAERAKFLAAYEADEARAGGTGGNWYFSTVRDLGKGYVRQVTDAHRRRVISSYTAATYLSAKVGQLDRLAAAATPGAM